MGSNLFNAFALLGVEEDQEASTIVAVKTAEVKKFSEEHKKIVAQQKKIAAEKKNKKKKSCGGHVGNAVDGQRYGHQLKGPEAANKERWLANQQQWLAREEERKKDMKLKTLKEYEEHKALEKQHKADKSSVPESTPLRDQEATPGNFTTKHRSKNGPARGRGTQDSGKYMNNGSYKAGYSKHNQESALSNEDDNTVKVKAEPALVPDLSETNFPLLG